MSEDPIPASLLATFFNSKDAQNLAQLSDEEFWRYARELAHLPPSVAAPAQEYIRCALAEGACLLPLAALREVVPMPRHFTLLPAIPVWMYGLTRWQDEPIAVVDLMAYFSQSRAPGQATASLLIAQNGYATLGLAVTVLSSVPSLEALSIRPPERSSLGHLSTSSGIIGLYEDAFVLDVPSLVTAMLQDITDSK